jgi:hypothetical protein
VLKEKVGTLFGLRAWVADVSAHQLVQLIVNNWQESMLNKRPGRIVVTEFNYSSAINKKAAENQRLDTIRGGEGWGSNS